MALVTFNFSYTPFQGNESQGKSAFELVTDFPLLCNEGWRALLRGALAVTLWHVARLLLLLIRLRASVSDVRLDPGTKKDAGTAIWASKLSPVGLLRVQDGLILLAAASGRKSATRILLAARVLQKAGSSDFNAAPVLQVMPHAPMNGHGSELF